MRALFAAILLALSTHGIASDARELMAASLLRHAPVPFVYEEQTLILSDHLGRYSVRTMKQYQRRDQSGDKLLMIVVTPVESNGMTVYVARDPGIGIRRGAKASSSVLGSDFLVSDLEREPIDEYRYEALPMQEIDHVKHHALRAVPIDNTRANATSATERMIFLREDNLFVSRIDYLDEQGRVSRRQSFRDPRPDETGAWRATMILMENLRNDQRSVLKIDRRVHSPDYVPQSIFAGLS